MRVLLRASEPSDVRARIDAGLPPSELRHDGNEIRVGAYSPLDGEAVRAAAAVAARDLRRTGGTIAWQVDTSLELSPESQVRALVEGTAYGAYDPGLFKRDYHGRPAVDLALDAPAELQPLAERQAKIVRHVDAARDLANRPSNDLSPVALAGHAKQYEGGSLAVEAHDRDWIVEHEMGAFAAVAAGSASEPQLIVMRYDPPGAGDVTLGLVGKAITFDSGGISLKPALRMQDMKGDMAGGGAVIEATAAIAELELPIRVVAVVASCENVQGSAAYKPGDILRASNGKTIEVINTDAEGRLVLADALHHARSLGATHVADFATLTGAMTISLGDLYAGWFCNDESFASAIAAASDTSGELAWRFPLHRRYRRYIDSDFADMKNASEFREGGAILAAKFLEEFAGDGPWAHFDIASSAYLQRRRPDYALDQGGTGYGVRLAVELAEQLR